MFLSRRDGLSLRESEYSQVCSTPLRNPLCPSAGPEHTPPVLGTLMIAVQSSNLAVFANIECLKAGGASATTGRIGRTRARFILSIVRIGSISMCFQSLGLGTPERRVAECSNARFSDIWCSDAWMEGRCEMAEIISQGVGVSAKELIGTTAAEAADAPQG